MTEISITVEESDNALLCRYGNSKIAEAVMFPGTGSWAFQYCDQPGLRTIDNERDFIHLCLAAFNAADQTRTVYLDYLEQQAEHDERFESGETDEVRGCYHLDILVEDYEVAA